MIKFVLDTQHLGLRMEPIIQQGLWELLALSDSNFANDKATRLSVYGYVIFFCNVPVAWKSKSMRSVVLSTTEAEYVALSEVLKEIKFIYQVLLTMGIRVPLPIKVRVNNIGAIWVEMHLPSFRHCVRCFNLTFINYNKLLLVFL